jgi:hypothetical protein
MAVMVRAAQLQWLIKCALALAMVLLACRLFTGLVGENLRQPATTTRDGSLITLNRYLREATPEIVMVGSSVTWRLKEEYFSIPKVRNLALAGGSPVTGLMIVANQPNLPKIILIETNVLSRAVDTELVDKFSQGDQEGSQFIRPIRTAVAVYENWNHAPMDQRRGLAEREELLRQPPSGFDNRIYVDRAVHQLNEESPVDAVRSNVEQLKELIEVVEKRGSRIFLIEVPFSPEIEATRSAKVTKDLVRDAFPDRQKWLLIDPPQTELRWADGVHLDERSSLIVVQSIERALAVRLGLNQ